MSNDPNIQFDASRFYDFVANMDKKTLNKAERDALRKSVRVVATQTRRNLRSRWPGGTSTKHGRRPSEGIVANVQKATTGQLYGQVHIMGNGRSNSRGYLLRFFEMGTDDRFAKVRSRAYRGRTVAELRASVPIADNDIIDFDGKRYVIDMIEKNHNQDIQTLYCTRYEQ